jgi:hypothetical protein
MLFNGVCMSLSTILLRFCVHVVLFSSYLWWCEGRILPADVPEEVHLLFIVQILNIGIVALEWVLLLFKFFISIYEVLF